MEKKEPKKRGPKGPSRLSETLMNEIFRRIRIGQPLERACDAVDVSKSQITEWRQRGEKPGAHELYVKFSNGLKKATVDCETEWLLKLQGKIECRDVDGYKIDWQRFAWLLERKFHDTWGRRDKITHTGDADGPPLFFIDRRFSETEKEKNKS